MYCSYLADLEHIMALQGSALHSLSHYEHRSTRPICSKAIAIRNVACAVPSHQLRLLYSELTSVDPSTNKTRRGHEIARSIDTNIISTARLEELLMQHSWGDTWYPTALCNVLLRVRADRVTSLTRMQVRLQVKINQSTMKPASHTRAGP